MRVVIVGAGLGGLAASIGLINITGYTSIDIIEKYDDFSSRRGATLGLAPNGIKALREILGEDDDNNVVDQMLESGKGKPGSTCMLPWWKVRDTLLEQVEQNEKVTIHRGCEFDSFIDDEDGESVGTLCYKDGIPLELEGDLIIGADGVNSVVRECLGLPKGKSAGSTTWRGCLSLNDFSEDDEYANELRPLLEQGNAPIGFTKIGNSLFMLFNHHPKPPGTLVWNISTKDEVQEGSHPCDILNHHVEKGSQNDKILQAIYKLANQNELRRPIKPKTIHPKVWGGSGRVTLLGDAAHAVRPATGLGASLAFEDCVVLLRRLKKAKQDMESTKQALRNFEKDRLGRVQYISDFEYKKSEENFKGVKKEVEEYEEYKKWVFAGV